MTPTEIENMYNRRESDQRLVAVETKLAFIEDGVRTLLTSMETLNSTKSNLAVLCTQMKQVQKDVERLQKSNDQLEELSTRVTRNEEKSRYSEWFTRLIIGSIAAVGAYFIKEH